jgi:hypothetical protein
MQNLYTYNFDLEELLDLFAATFVASLQSCCVASVVVVAPLSTITLQLDRLCIAPRFCKERETRCFARALRVPMERTFGVAFGAITSPNLGSAQSVQVPP